MSKLSHKIWPKILAFFLTLLLGYSAIAGAAGIFTLAQEGVFLDGGRNLRTILYNSTCHNEAVRAYYYFNGLYWDYTTAGIDEGAAAEEIAAAFSREFSQENCDCALTVQDTEGHTYQNYDLPDGAGLYTATYDFYTTPETAADYSRPPLVENEDGTTYVPQDFPMTVTATLSNTYRSDTYGELLVSKLLEHRVGLIVLTVLCTLLCIFAFGFLMASMGHWAGHEGIHLTWFDRIPWDVLALAPLAGGILTVNLRYASGGWSELVAAALLLTPAVLLWLCSFVSRCKAGSVFRSSLICRVLRLLWRGVRWVFATLGMMKAVWKTALCALVLLLVDLICLANGQSLLLLAVNVLACCWLIHIAWGLRKLEQGAEKLAEGDYSRRIDLRHLHGSLRRGAENLNRVQSGAEKAVAARMKSERMKTELITNVSHDIKTPLTSIVNYVDLLKKEPLPEGKAQEYLEVLDRQSKRLKKLTEDLVELSKASSGVMPVNLQRVDVNVLLSQVEGEYRERLEAAGLTLVVLPGSEGVCVQADPVLLSRVTDNLMGNACKYAMPGTRVYVSLAREAQRVSISVKNVSREELNISAEELQERFVRGDNSRTSEGSGLGLSIARSLVQLQGGQFDVIIDGDLFRADVTLPELPAAT